MSLKMKLGIGMSNQLLHASASLHVCTCWLSFVQLLHNFPTTDFIFFFVVKNCPSITDLLWMMVHYIKFPFRFPVLKGKVSGDAKVIFQGIFLYSESFRQI